MSAPRLIPVERYVGGEAYSVTDWHKPSACTAAQLRAYLAQADWTHEARTIRTALMEASESGRSVKVMRELRRTPNTADLWESVA